MRYASTYEREKVMFGTDSAVRHSGRAIKQFDAPAFDPLATQMRLRTKALPVFKLPGYRQLKRNPGIVATRRT